VLGLFGTWRSADALMHVPCVLEHAAVQRGAISTLTLFRI
jgi:hypothetical protein